MNHINWAYWSDDQDTPQLIEELKQAISSRDSSIGTPAKIDLLPLNEPFDLPRPYASAQPGTLEIPEGTMKLKSAFYVERLADSIGMNTIVQEG